MTPDPPESILPPREDVALAFCQHCGQVCDVAVPKPGGKWKCSACRRRCRLPRADVAYRMRLLLGLLHSRNQNVVAMAQHGLTTYDDASVKGLLEELVKSPRISERIAPVLGRVGGRQAVDALVKGMRSREGKRRRQKWIWRWVLLAGAVLSIYYHNWCVGLFLLGCMSVPSFLPYNKAAAQALEALRDPVASGALAVAHRTPELQPVTTQALKTLLPRLSEEHAGEMQALHDLINSYDAELAISAIRALGVVGNRRSLSALEWLSTQRRAGDRVGDAAREAIPVLLRHLEWRKERKQLLRAAHPALEDTDSLLRPASPGETEPKQLLRPADGPGAEE